MKQFLALALTLSTAFFAGAQGTAVSAPQTSTATAEVLSFKQTSHDFGSIPQGKPVYYSFEVVNTSATAVKLEDVKASCGCTTPEWSRDAIPAGGSTQIKVGFNAAAEGPFNKPITVTFDGGHVKELHIKGNVWKAPEGAAPANASVQFLKKQTL